MKNKNDGKWMCALNEDREDWSYNCAYDTKEEAVRATREAIKRYNLDPDNVCLDDELGETPDTKDTIVSFAVGQAIYSGAFFDVETLIEQSQEMAWDEGGEFAQDYLDDVTDEHKEELEDLVQNWFVRHDYLPSFFKIYDIDVIQVYEVAE